MKRQNIPILAFLALLLLTIPFSFDFATSVVPGWHTTIFPPASIWAITIMLVLFFAAIGYWLLSKRVDKINWTLFIVHIILTIPILIFIRLPFIFLNMQQADEEEIIKTVSLQIKLTPVARTLFIVGQFLFIIYFVRTVNSKQPAK